MRIFRTAWVLTPLAACHPAAPEQPQDATLPRIACAHAGQPLRADCTIERQGKALIVRHPDGGFRRLTRTATGIVPADGVAQATRGADGLVAIDGDRYRLSGLPQ